MNFRLRRMLSGTEVDDGFDTMPGAVTAILSHIDIWITSSRRSCSIVTSMSGGVSRASVDKAFNTPIVSGLWRGSVNT